jgi:hypothetical protein
LLQADPPTVRAFKLLGAVNFSETVAMLHGLGTQFFNCKATVNCNYTGATAPNGRLGIPSLRMADGPQGYRDFQSPGTSTAFPSGLTVGATWDRGMAGSWGRAMGQEYVPIYRRGGPWARSTFIHYTLYTMHYYGPWARSMLRTYIMSISIL